MKEWEFAEKAKRVAAESAEELKEKLSSVASLEDLEGLKEAAGDLAEGAATFVKKYPVQSVLGALAVGFVVGTLLTRKK